MAYLLSTWGKVEKGGIGWTATSRPSVTQGLLVLGLTCRCALYATLVLPTYLVSAGPERLEGASHLGVEAGHHSLLILINRQRRIFSKDGGNNSDLNVTQVRLACLSECCLKYSFTLLKSVISS